MLPSLCRVGQCTNDMFKFIYFSALLFFIICSLEVVVKGAKLRTWVGPDTYFEGDLPSPRQGHEMISTDDGLLFIFGGWGNSGKERLRVESLEFRPKGSGFRSYGFKQ